MSDLGEVSRKLVAVFAADVEGYSRLMGVDEVGTLRGLTERRAILDRLIEEHRGRIANTAGDSVLAEFGSAVDAVQCAVEAQGALAEANAGVPSDKQISFRIGVHIGDVMVRAGDLFGDGVNIAARLQTLAAPGSLCISGATYDQVRKVLPITFEDLGAQNVKNIEEPVRAYQAGASSVATVAARSRARIESLPPLPEKPSIAVLPFQSMSADPEQNYFADGIVEDIITALSRFKSLFVIARNSSFTYKGKSVDIKQVGRELGVRYVLEGSVRKAGGRVRITGQLIEATTGTHLWADHFDGMLDDVFLLQDRVTETAVSAILPRVERAEIDRSRAKPTESLQAYDYYLRGIHRLNSILTSANDPRLILAAVNEARGCMEQAIVVDSEFALAHAIIGQCLLLQSQNDPSVDRASLVTKVLQVSRRAAILDPDDAAVLSYAGQALAYVAGQIDEGARLLERAISINPNLALAWNFGGWAQVFCGDPHAALERFSRAMRLNPLDPFLFLMQLGNACGHLFAGDHQEAAAWAERALRERPNSLIGLRIAAACFALAERLEDARKAAARVEELAPNFRISHVKATFPLRRTEHLAKYCQGLRLAGLPE